MSRLTIKQFNPKYKSTLKRISLNQVHWNENITLFDLYRILKNTFEGNNHSLTKDVFRKYSEAQSSPEPESKKSNLTRKGTFF